MKSLLALLLEENAQTANANLAVTAFAQQISRIQGAPFDLLVFGDSDPEKWLYYGAEQVYLASALELAHASPQVIAEYCVIALGGTTGLSLAGPATQFGTDTLASLAGMLGLPMLSSVYGLEDVDGQAAFYLSTGKKREVVQVDSDRVVLSVSRTAFGAAETIGKSSRMEKLPDLRLPLHRGFASREEITPPSRQTLDLSNSRVVVAGGRALGDAESFQQLIGGLAEKLHGVPAATGVAVQAGIAPKEILVGQTGQIVSPDLYIAAGISGSDQHTGGMRDSRVIVAINNNPNTAIFRMADYGLVADVHQALPELIEKL